MAKEQELKKPDLVAAGIALDDEGNHISVLIEEDQTAEEAVNATIARAKLREKGRFNDDRFGTGGQHVARDLEGKVGWREGSMPRRGPDPEGKRNYLGDEFNGIIGYDAKGKPAFWSHFKDVKSIDDLEGKTIKICLADEFPDKLKGNPSIERTADAWGRDPVTGRVNKPEDEARRVHPRFEEQIRKFVAESQNSGMPLEIVDDPADAHITVMAWQRDVRPRLLGFASFPDSMNTWGQLRGLGAEAGKGFAFLSNDYANDPSVTDEELQHVFVHESGLGHNMGMCHPHDLARLNISQSEALASTVMAYSDMHAKKVKGTEGADVGALDYSFRNWMPNPPKLNTGEGGVYDLQEHMEATYARDKNSRGYMRSRLLPTAAIVDHGKGTELHGTQGDDFIDTNPGYATIVNTPDGRGKQKFLMAEGHIEIVRGVAGNNTIVPCDEGDQKIFPGSGNNTIAFYNQSIGGTKKIFTHGPGEDTLVLSENILGGHPNLNVRSYKGSTIIGEGSESIIIDGKGIDNIRIIDSLGQTVLDKSIKDLSADDIQQQVFNAARALLEDRAEGHNHATGEDPANDNRTFTQRLADERRTGTDRSNGIG